MELIKYNMHESWIRDHNPAIKTWSQVSTPLQLTVRVYFVYSRCVAT